MTLAPMLNDRGKLIGDFSLANLGHGRYFLAGSGIAETYHLRWFNTQLPGDGSVSISAQGTSLEHSLTRTSAQTRFGSCRSDRCILTWSPASSAE